MAAQNTETENGNYSVSSFFPPFSVRRTNRSDGFNLVGACDKSREEDEESLKKPRELSTSEEIALRMKCTRYL